MLRRFLRWIGVDIPEYRPEDDWLIRDVQEAKEIVRRRDRLATSLWRAREGIGRE